MAVKNVAATTWKGSLFEGSGEVALESSHTATLGVNWKARSEGSSSTTTPEELIAAAHSACFSMALSNELTENGTAPTSLHTTAEVTFDAAGGGIKGSHLIVEAEVPGLDQATFAKIAEGAKQGCPVSQALTGIEITLDATLK
ncbi:MAG: OsmC family peroxiredoxin [Pseudoclavibacter sp.]|jgi:osmotically inducible protein OsmC